MRIGLAFKAMNCGVYSRPLQQPQICLLSSHSMSISSGQALLLAWCVMRLLLTIVVVQQRACRQHKYLLALMVHLLWI